MRPLHRTGSILAAGCIGLIFFGNASFAQLVSREEIVQALIAQPAPLRLADRLRLTRSLI